MKRCGRLVVSFVVLLVVALAVGALPAPRAAEAATGQTPLQERLYGAWRNHEETVDVSDLHVPDSTTAYIIRRDIITTHPLYRMAIPLSPTVAASGGYLQTVTVQFSPYIGTQEHIDQYYEHLTQALACVDGVADEVTKALLLHDWVATHCNYSASATYADYAYGVLVEGRAACQGYAEAYRALCLEAGLECTVVSATNPNHAWNLVRVDGSWYHVDCCWDDDTMNLSADTVKHENFLLTNEQIATTTSAHGTEWSAANGQVATATAIADPWWSSSSVPNRAFAYLDGSLYYADGTAVMKRAVGSSTAEALPGSEAQEVGRWTCSAYRRVLADGEYIYSNSAQQVNVYGSDGTLAQTVKPDVSSDYIITGISFKDARLLCDVYAWNESTGSYEMRYGLELGLSYECGSHSLIEVAGVTPVCTATGLKHHWVCARCGASFLDAVAAVPVGSDELVLAKDPNNHGVKAQQLDASTVVERVACVSDGYTGDTVCLGCKAVTKQGAVVLAHETETQPAQAATCQKEGRTEAQVCKDCGTTVSGGEAVAKDPAAHAGGTEARVTKAATCRSEGAKATLCKGCGATLATEAVAKLAHTPVTKNAVTATTKLPGYTGDQVCSSCGAVLKKGAALNKVNPAYRGHVQSYGWMDWVTNGALCGTSGQSKRVEAFGLKLTSQPYDGSVEYRVHVQSLGWTGWTRNGADAGTTGKSKRLEAVHVRLTGTMAERYDGWVRARVQGIGWQGWVKNGIAGTTGQSRRVEAVQLRVLPKGETPQLGGWVSHLLPPGPPTLSHLVPACRSIRIQRPFLHGRGVVLRASARPPFSLKRIVEVRP